MRDAESGPRKSTVFAPTGPQLVQIAMCSADLPRSVQFYSEVFGFADAGGQCLYGSWPAALLELGTPDVSGTTWWLTGRQGFFQLELFQYTHPVQRPQPADWQPSDHGWVRWGVAVSDFDACLDRLRERGISPVAPREFKDGTRRSCFRDPWVGAFVEIFQDSPAVPGGVRATHFMADPAVVYVSVSVPDLNVARAFFVAGLGLAEQADPNVLHVPGMEYLWGLDGAQRSVFVVQAGDVFIEVLQYSRPVSRPKPAGYRLVDQGLMNCALGWRARRDFDPVISRLAGQTCVPTMPVAAQGPFAFAYLRAPDGTSIELGAMTAEMDEVLGFAPRRSFADVLGV
jgi:catechol 2,3-dioxygenase-like lactoylglutathione lyase family enzyme